MNPQATNITSTPANGASTASELFALTDEQILEIEPEPQDVELTAAAEVSRDEAGSAPAAQTGRPKERTASATTGPFAAAEDLQVLGELYPGGLSQAKTAAERARTLDEFDAAYFGAAETTPEQLSASRAQLAQRMMREDPAAFREMVFAGLRALEGTSSATASQISPQSAAPGASAVVARHAAPLQGKLPQVANESVADGHPAYAAFERAANDELERSVGVTIERTIAQALPNLGRGEAADSAGARSGNASLRERLASSVRQDVEAALKGDQQLGQQIAQILAAKRFDDAARAQVVRLINDRASQLVPGAARRVIGEWTSATLAAHGAMSERSTAASAKREVAPAASAPTAATSQSRTARSDTAIARSRSLDYRKLSDEQILEL